MIGTITLPLGWSPYQDEDGEPYQYKYDGAPSSSTFWYPIPTVRDVQPAIDHQWGPVIYCKTLRGYLAIGEPFPQQVEDDD